MLTWEQFEALEEFGEQMDNAPNILNLRVPKALPPAAGRGRRLRDLTELQRRMFVVMFRMVGLHYEMQMIALQQCTPTAKATTKRKSKSTDSK
jgi:hypothetical protein